MLFKATRAGLLGLILLLAGACASPPPLPTLSNIVGPVLDADGFDAEALGRADGYPRGVRGRVLTRREYVGSFSAYDQIWQARTLAKPASPSPLTRAAAPPIRVNFRGESLTIDDYLARNPTTALLIAKGNTIYVERYRYGRSEATRFTSFSMAKTLTAMLVGIAVGDGHIRSISDTAETYVPELRGSEYGRTPLKALLSMSSGVAFEETYSGSDDVSKLARGSFVQAGPGGPGILRQFNHRVAAPDTRYSYASAETQVLGAVVAAATGRTLADYAAEKIWQPMGAEADASWLIDKAGLESAYCCFQATLRDWARFGLMLAHDGVGQGQQIVPRQWLIDAATPDPARPHLHPRRATPYYGYGYQTWLFPDMGRNFALQGVYGQTIYVDPASQLVMVHLAARQVSRDPDAGATVALWLGVKAALGGR